MGKRVAPFLPRKATRIPQIWPWLCLVLPFLIVVTASIDKSTTRKHSSNFAVIVSTSRYWFNYRHNTNALLLYQYLRTYGNFTDENIVLMLADEYALNPRNPLKNRIFNTATDGLPAVRGRPRRKALDALSSSLYTEDIEIDYRGEDVTVENFINVLTGHHSPHGPPVLPSDADSHILIYMTGHAGDLFFKFQDVEEITALQLADALELLHISRRYREILLVADTCQAFTIGDTIVERKLPNISIIGSSLRGESSYAHSGNPVLGLATVEKYTHFLFDVVAQRRTAASTIAQLMVEPFNSSKQTNMLGAHVGMDDSNSVRKLSQVPWNDFFANVQYASPQSSVTAAKVHLLPDVLTSGPPWWMINVGSSIAPKSESTKVPTTGTSDSFSPPEFAASVSWKYHLEPDHPVFVLLVLGLCSLVARGSRFF